MEYPKCPECEKLNAAAPYSQKIGEFIEWLHTKGICLAEWVEDSEYPDEDEGDLRSIRTNKQDLLAEFFEIDMNKVEKEREQMLAYLQEKPDA